MTRADARDFLQLAADVKLHPKVHIVLARAGE
jgi:hypothetical protein